MNQSRQWMMFGAVLIAGCLWTLAGCKDDTAPPDKPYPVKGKVVYEDGTPVPGGSVYFDYHDPEGKSTKRYHAFSPIGPDGTFALSFAGDKDGAPVGIYKVWFGPLPQEAPAEGVEQPSDENSPPPKYAVAVEFRNKTTTPLEIEVKAQSNDVTLTVKKPAD
jgi:hypothetical protein